jgi:hypothetical protein
MASTITNYSINIDTTFPVPGQDNDTQGFRDNFIAIKNSFDNAAFEITDMQVTNIGIINKLNTFTAPSTLNASIATATILNSVTIANSGSISTYSLVADGNITTNGRFIGDGSALSNLTVDLAGDIGILTNLTVTNVVYAGSIITTGTISASTITGTLSVGTMTSLTIGAEKVNDASSATLTVRSGRLIIDGINGITITTTASTTATLIGAVSQGLSDNIIILNSVANIDVGYTFKLYSTETTVHHVLGLNTTTNIILTDPFDPTNAIANGVTSGTVLTFYQGQQVGSVFYAGSAPTSAVGKLGDRKGTIFATSTTMYMCYADYVNSTTSIWSKVSITSW